VALGDTSSIRTAAFVRIAVLVTVLGGGVVHGGWAGIYVATVANLLAEISEVGALQISVRQALRAAPVDA
jgi:hypothetical protein